MISISRKIWLWGRWVGWAGPRASPQTYVLRLARQCESRVAPVMGVVYRFCIAANVNVPTRDQSGGYPGSN